MNTCVFYYDGFCGYEVVLAVNMLRDSFFAAALENRVHVSIEKQKYLPDKTISELNPDDIDCSSFPEEILISFMRTKI